MRPRTFFFVFAVLSVPPAIFAACSSSSSTSTTTGGDSGGGGQDAGIDSTCGQPSDPGNEVGVGKFCKVVGDCIGNKMATICSVLGDQTTHFCTKTCKNPDGGTSGTDEGGLDDNCGTGATCSCDDQGCGCTPNQCL